MRSSNGRERPKVIPHICTAILSAHNLWRHLARARARAHGKHGRFALTLSSVSWKMAIAHQRARAPQLFFPVIIVINIS